MAKSSLWIKSKKHDSSEKAKLSALKTQKVLLAVRDNDMFSLIMDAKENVKEKLDNIWKCLKANWTRNVKIWSLRTFFSSGLMAYACNLITQKGEARRLSQVWSQPVFHCQVPDQPGLQNKTVSKLK